MPLTEYQKEQRKKHIGASESASILGVSPYATAHDVWLQRTGRVPPFEGNEACAIGDLVEDGLLDWGAGEVGDKITKNQFRVHSGGILSATHDALSRVDADVGYEAKSAGIMVPWGTKDEWGTAGTDQIPQQYIIQCQHQMIVSDLQTVHVPALIAGRGRVLYTVNRNETLCEYILEECSKFWTECIQKDMPPSNSTPTLEIIKKIRREEGKRIHIDVDAVREWREAKALESRVKKEAKAAEAAMLKALGDAQIGECSLGIVRMNPSSSNRFDRKGLAVVHPNIEKEFSIVTESTKLSWKAAKSA